MSTNSAAQYTPGPWFFDEITGRIVTADGKAIAFAAAAHESSQQNGQVLAAAPDLLEALRALLDASSGTWPFVLKSDARAAISKALGEQPQ